MRREFVSARLELVGLLRPELVGLLRCRLSFEVCLAAHAVAHRVIINY